MTPSYIVLRVGTASEGVAFQKLAAARVAVGVNGFVVPDVELCEVVIAVVGDIIVFRASQDCVPFHVRRRSSRLRRGGPCGADPRKNISFCIRGTVYAVFSSYYIILCSGWYSFISTVINCYTSVVTLVMVCWSLSNLVTRRSPNRPRLL